MTSGTLTTTFEYDGLGNRTAQTVDGVTTEYVLDVAGGPPEVIVATVGGASTRYVQVQGQILAQQEAGAWGYVLPDHLGSVRQLVDAAGQVSLAQSYDPFGVLHLQHGTPNPQLPFGYTGEQVDPSTGLVFLRARYYEPVTGRFLSEDLAPGDYQRPLTMNPYLYTDANPVNRVDPSGRFSNEAIAATFGVDSFDQVMEILEQTGGRWGLLRLLQEAQQGDTLEVGYEGKPAPAIMQPGRFVCRNGKIETENVGDFKQYLEFLQNARFNVATKWWRANTIDWYFLNGGGFLAPNAPAWWKGGYTDWKDQTDLPDFYMVSGGVAAVGTVEVAYIVDRYGRRYWSGALGFGIPLIPLPIDVSYAEGYIGQWNYGVYYHGGPMVVKKTRPATRGEIEGFLIGFGETGWGTVGGGSISFGGAAALFGVGLPGIGWTASATTFLDATGNPDLAWDWLDHAPMIGRYNILSEEQNDSISNCECQ